VIARIWSGRVRTADADRYVAYMESTGLADYRGTPGNLSATLLRRADGAVTNFTFVTLWDSMDSIRAFAGDDVGRAVYYPEDENFLLELPDSVTHHDVSLHAFSV
jgi:hypothetical protein